FLLDNAAWPAMLVDKNRKITKANRAAVNFFGTVAVKEGAQVAGIWAETDTGVDSILVQISGERGQASRQFRLTNGSSGFFRTQCSPGSSPDVSLLQLFPTEPPKNEFVLENAKWPAFLLGENQKIAKANSIAGRLFGGEAVKEGAWAGSMWATDNTVPFDKVVTLPG